MCPFLQPRQAVHWSSVRAGCQEAMCIPGSLGVGPFYLPGWGRDSGCRPRMPTQACVAYHRRLTGILPQARVAGNQGATGWEGALWDCPAPFLAMGLQRGSCQWLEQEFASDGPAGGQWYPHQHTRGHAPLTLSSQDPGRTCPSSGSRVQSGGHSVPPGSGSAPTATLNLVCFLPVWLLPPRPRLLWSLAWHSANLSVVPGLSTVGDWYIVAHFSEAVKEGIHSILSFLKISQ